MFQHCDTRQVGLCIVCRISDYKQHRVDQQMIQITVAMRDNTTRMSMDCYQCITYPMSTVKSLFYQINKKVHSIGHRLYVLTIDNSNHSIGK